MESDKTTKTDVHITSVLMKLSLYLKGDSTFPKWRMKKKIEICYDVSIETNYEIDMWVL